VLRSEQLLDHLIEKFDLLHYYGVDLSPKKYPFTTVKGILGSNISFRRTQYNSIEIEVIDHSSKMASDMANEITNYADTINCNIIRQRSKQAYDIVLDEYNRSKENIKKLTDSLTIIRSYGITDYERQAEALTQEYAKAIVKKDSEAMKALEKKLQILQKYGSIYDMIRVKFKIDLQRQSYLEGKVAAAKLNYEHKFSSVFVVDKAVPAEKKYGPKRILIVFLSTVSAFFLTLLVFLVENNIKNRL